MPRPSYHDRMPSRLQHAFRFALPNLVAVLIAALVYEVVALFVRRDVPGGMTAGGAIAANMAVWGMLAAVVGIVTLLMRLSDTVTRVPGWGFAWLEATWVAVACVVVVHLVSEGAHGMAVGVGVAAALVWLAVHRRIPGWPGAASAAAEPAGDAAANAVADVRTPDARASEGRRPERHLP